METKWTEKDVEAIGCGWIPLELWSVIVFVAFVVVAVVAPFKSCRRCDSETMAVITVMLMVVL